MSAEKKKSLVNQHIANVSGLRVSICCEPDEHYSDWIRDLQSLKLEVARIWPPPPARLSADMDVLICEYFPQIGELIPWMPGDAEAALIIVLPEDGKYDDDVLLSVAPQCVVQRPFANKLICSTVKVAWSQYRYERRLLDRMTRLDENVRSARDVERAKLIIMHERKVDEEAAYKYLRDLAMQQQVTVASVVTSIIQNPEQAL